jgi:hypothetical protein
MLADVIAYGLGADPTEIQSFLNQTDIVQRLKQALTMMQKFVESTIIQQKIHKYHHLLLTISDQLKKVLQSKIENFS